MSKVLESTNFVTERAKHVKIKRSKINEFCKDFDHSHVGHWISEAPYDFTNLNDKEKLHFLLVFNSISFCYWGDPKWTVEYQGERFDGSWGMITALGRAIENKIPVLNMKYLASISDKDFEKITKANVKIPLFEDRLEIIREVGYVMTKKFEGDFSKLIDKAEGDAMKLLNLILLNFPSFSDSSTYKGKTVYFYKRAQLLVSDIYQMFRGKSYGNLKNISQLTACADYKIPQVLRKLRILSYSKELAEKVDKKINILKGSEEEIEIRASTIWANELIKRKLKERIPHIDSIHINDHLWLLGQIKLPDDKPYHLTRTTSY